MSDELDGADAEEMIDAGESHTVTSIGDESGTVEVQIGSRFLQLFSDQLYTSPNKAFEELVSNAWDAGATNIRIGASADLASTSACLWVLDDGESMDAEGLAQLWQVASSPKSRDGYVPSSGRPPIGKFGIGKLATYALANELTYVCRAQDGVVRAVTLDYRRISEDRDGQLHVEKLPLPLRDLDDEQLTELLNEIGDQRLSQALGEKGELALPPAKEPASDEFGGAIPDSGEPRGTWTLVVLSALKPKGRSLKRGVVKRMLRAALPLGEQIRIAFDSDVPLASSKIDQEVMAQWDLGDKGLNLTEISLVPDDDEDDPDDGNLPASDDASAEAAAAPEEVRVSSPEDAVGAESEPAEAENDAATSESDTERTTLKISRKTKPKRIELDGFPSGITGRIVIFEESIQGKKSDRRAPSNGFHVNVRGRVVNVHDNAFGLPALSHTVWSKLRVTIRADDLHDDLAVSREGVFEGERADALRALLRAIFNVARKHHDDTERARWPDVSDILVGDFGTVPLTPLLGVVTRSLAEGSDSAGLVGFGDIDDRDKARADFAEQVTSNPGKAIDDVVLEPLGSDDELVRYDFSSRRVILNASHPFVREYAQTHDQQELLQKTGLVELLSDAFLLEDLDVDPAYIRRLREYRERFTRLLARRRRQNASVLAEVLLATSSHDKAFEIALGDSIEALGFDVVRQGQKNKPEGLATAKLDPAPDDPKHPKDPEDRRREYRFIYEAKSSSQDPQKVSTKDVNVSGQKRHRNNAAADTDDPDHPFEHILVVAPAYAKGALEEETKADDVCAMRAETLARLLLATVATGPLDLVAFREILSESGGPDEVDAKATELIDAAKTRTHVSLPEILEAIEGRDTIDPLHCGTIADRVRSNRGGAARKPDGADVARVLGGLSLMVPEALQLSGENVMLGASPARIAQALRERMNTPPVKASIDELAEIFGDLLDDGDKKQKGS